jgi:hypothetical protein
MNPAMVVKLFVTPSKGWKEVVKKSPPVHQLFIFYVVPLALIPSLIIGHADQTQAWEILKLLNPRSLPLVGAALFVIQLIVVAMMAIVMRQLADLAETKVSFKSAFTLAAICPTPLWLSAIALLIPSSLLVIAAVCLAMMASVGLMYYGVPEIYKLRNQGQSMLLFGGILIAGVVAMGFLMVATLVIWGSLQNLTIAS